MKNVLWVAVALMIAIKPFSFNLNLGLRFNIK